MAEDLGQLKQSLSRGQDAVLADLERITENPREFEAVQPKLVHLQEQILTLLQFQSQRLMPLAQRVVSANRAQQVEFLNYEIREMKVKTLEFFDRYGPAPNAIIRRNFVKDFMQYRKEVLAWINSQSENMLPLLN